MNKMDWKVRAVRMSDELWFNLVACAAKQRKNPSEFIREVILRELNNGKTDL